MAQNNDLISAELNNCAKSMLVDFIVTQSLPASVKLSDDISAFLKNSSSTPVTLSTGKSIKVASIILSVVEEFKSVALSNSKLHDKINRLNMTANASIPKSNTQPINLPITVHPKSDTDTLSRQPAN
jgi:hypothetical protein